MKIQGCGESFFDNKGVLHQNYESNLSQSEYETPYEEDKFELCTYAMLRPTLLA